MYKNDIDTLLGRIPNTYNYKIVLTAQIRLLLRNLPSALLGTVFTSLCFYATMYTTRDLSPNQQALNTIWLAYHTLIVMVFWLLVRVILKSPNTLNMVLLRKIFAVLIFLFTTAMFLCLPIFIAMLSDVPSAMVHEAKILIGVWIFFHIAIIYVCWFNWQKIKSLVASTTDAKDAMTDKEEYSSIKKLNSQFSLNFNRSFFNLNYQVPSPSAKSYDHYLAHYTVYSVLFICAFATACLWALAIGKAFITNIQNSTQVIV